MFVKKPPSSLFREIEGVSFSDHSFVFQVKFVPTEDDVWSLAIGVKLKLTHPIAHVYKTKRQNYIAWVGSFVE